MERSFESVLVEQCAPTLAGVKPASLFRWQTAEGQPAGEAVSHWSRELTPFGLKLRVLKICSRTGGYLLYLYRTGWLRRILAEPANRAFLRQMGYPAETDCGGLLEELSERLCLEQDFPHEIGVFLGYPLEDVIGFIQNRGRNYSCCGYWKAYGDPEAAHRRFETYRRCTAHCQEQFRQGVGITGLIAA